MTTLVARCAYSLPIVFWQLVNWAVLGYSLAFLFWPDVSMDLFVDNALNEATLRYTGVLLVLVTAGMNQMLSKVTGGSEMFLRSSFAFSMLLYVLGSVAGVVVLMQYGDEIFIEEQRVAFLVLFSLFLGGVFIGFCGTCGGYFTVTAGASTPPLTTIVSTEAGISRRPVQGPPPRSRQDLRDRR